MNTLSGFANFAKQGKNTLNNGGAKVAVVYTRVSSKEQADTNLSLDFQRKAIEEHALRGDIQILEYFGGTYESAKTDGRKEFQRMLDFIKKNKGKITHILVYMLDRFSRTGGAAIKLAEELRIKYGVEIFAVSQPTDTSNPSGIFQQNIQFLFSHYDNELRKQRSIAGMKEKFKRGIWVAKPPIGYDIVKTNGVRKIVINSVGKKIKKAFVWKSEGMKNEAILERLRSLGIKLNKQHLTKIFKNPFYCGLLSHSMLEGQLVEGTHEILVSKALFLQVNEIHRDNPGYGVPHKKLQDEVPLKVFIRCSDCNQPFTGYIVKAKGLWYYKCRTKGCKCNQSAIRLHKQFIGLMEQYCIRTELKAPLLAMMESVWMDINKERIQLEKEYKKQLAALEEKLESIEESYFINKEMSKETYEKFRSKFMTQHQEIASQLSKTENKVSNPTAVLEKALDISINLATEWNSADIEHKEKLQKLVFPDGIVFDKKTGVLRTDRVNVIFELIADLSDNTGDNEKRQTGDDACLSPLVRVEGLEPPSLAALDPKSSVSTNFTTPAKRVAKVSNFTNAPNSFSDCHVNTISRPTIVIRH